MTAGTGNVALVQRLYESVWNDGDLSVADELVSVSEVHHSHGGTSPGGPEAQKRAARLFREAFPDNRLTVEVVVDGGDLVAVRWRIEGTHAVSGRPIRDYTGVNIFRIEGDKIAEIWDTRDDLGLCAQLGMIPSRRQLWSEVYRPVTGQEGDQE